MMNVRLFSVLIPVLLASGCSSAGKSSDNHLRAAAGAINHLVLFELRDQAYAEELIADCDRLVAAVGNLRSYFRGRHLDTGRPIVRDDYHVAFMVSFSSREELMRYGQHPMHLELAGKWKPRLASMRVYDIYDDR